MGRGGCVQLWVWETGAPGESGGLGHGGPGTWEGGTEPGRWPWWNDRTWDTWILLLDKSCLLLCLSFPSAPSLLGCSVLGRVGSLVEGLDLQIWAEWV